MDPSGREYTLRCRKKFRREGISPLTGDEIRFSPGEGESHGWIEEIFPRRSETLRPPCANLTLLVFVAAPVPETDWLLADRLIARAFGQGLKALIVVNKSDLSASTTTPAPASSPIPASSLSPASAPLADRVRAQYAPAGIPVLSVSAATGAGLSPLREALKGETACFAGQSGVGKTSLLNALLGTMSETGEISQRISRGKNTTRSAELYLRNGLRIVDSAGFNLLEAEKGLAPDLLKDRYPEFRPFEGRCRFRGCLHDREPGCAVRAAAESSQPPAPPPVSPVSRERWERYRLLLEELRLQWDHRWE